MIWQPLFLGVSKAGTKVTLCPHRHLPIDTNNVYDSLQNLPRIIIRYDRCSSFQEDLHVIISLLSEDQKNPFLYNFQNFCIQNTNDYPKVHFGLPIFSEVPKTTHMLSDSLERLTGFYIYTYIFFNSQLQFITVKRYSRISKEEKHR